MSRFPIPAARHSAEVVIERSRFRCTLAHAATPAEAQGFIREIAAADPGATHHCWAYLAGPPGSTSHVGLSDDGEPHGTAGRPMLTVPLHSGVGEIAAVVTRWYGGVKLGTGGLVRAYSEAVALALAALPRTEKVEWAAVEIVIGYPNVSAVQRLLPTFEGEILEQAWEADVRLVLRVPAPARDALVAALVDATHGEVVVA
jgi:uncharacterized YigZ family protein